MIATKDSSQSKADKRVDRSLKSKPTKFIPLVERDFNDLMTLAEQFEWLKRKQKQKDKL